MYRINRDVPPHLPASGPGLCSCPHFVLRAQRHPDVHHLIQPAHPPVARVFGRGHGPHIRVALLEKSEDFFQPGELVHVYLVEPVDVGLVHQTPAPQLGHVRVQHGGEVREPVLVVHLVGRQVEQIEGIQLMPRLPVVQFGQVGGFPAVEVVDVEPVVNDEVLVPAVDRGGYRVAVQTRQHVIVQGKRGPQGGALGQGDAVDPHLQRQRARLLPVHLDPQPALVGARLGVRPGLQRDPDRHARARLGLHLLLREQRVRPPACTFHRIEIRRSGAHVPHLVDGVVGPGKGRTGSRVSQVFEDKPESD